MSAVLEPITSSQIIQFDEAVFDHNFNRRWFTLEHCLADSPLFDLDRLIVLARQTAMERPSDLYFDQGATWVGQRWNQTPACMFPVDETIRRLEREDAWIVLKHAEKDPDYEGIINETMREVLELTGREMARLVKFAEVILFISSPGRLTTYHIDRECNFIAQIRGKKTIHIFDRDDREVLPEPEIERFWTVDNNAAEFKPDLQGRADSFLLRPGNGVHIPVNAPHWLQNHDDISITASLNFKFKDSCLANIYRANYVLRKMGLKPMPPGESAVRDRFKSAMAGGVLSAMQAAPNRWIDTVKRVFG